MFQFTSHLNAEHVVILVCWVIGHHSGWGRVPSKKLQKENCDKWSKTCAYASYINKSHVTLGSFARRPSPQPHVCDSTYFPISIASGDEIYLTKVVTARMDFKVLVLILNLVNIVNLSLGEVLCTNCANGDLSVDELTEARIEIVKQQILKKLRLEKKPELAIPVNSLPMPVAQGQTFSSGTEKPNDFDEYYGRTEQKIIFPVEGELFNFI